MTGPRRIALLMSQDAEFHRQVLLGIHAYAGRAKRWLFHTAPPTQAVLRPLAEWNPHGIIAHLDDARVAHAILKLGKPVVDTACIFKGLNVPTVDTDHVAIGQLAADYLLARGYRHFGFFGSGLAIYSQLREASFRKAVEQAGFEVRDCHIEYLPHLPDRISWTNVDFQIRTWLKELKKPVAVLADHDVAAHDLADMCLILGLGVPDDVAILGVDNEELECQLAFPPLSSVAIPAERLGFEAASLLDRIMSGKHVDNGPLYLPPIRVVTRQSTSVFAVNEPIVTAALHYIRNHLAEPLKVSGIAAELTVRRRELEERFRTLLGRSVLDEIHRVRVERAKELLASTDMPVSAVAGQTGFSIPRRLAAVFQKVVGVAPGEYRRQTRVRHQP
jgi:LacI family transcriptional regulator